MTCEDCEITAFVLRQGIYETTGAAPVLRGGGRTDYFQIQREALFRMLQPV